MTNRLYVYRQSTGPPNTQMWASFASKPEEGGFPDQALAWLAVFSELSFAGGEGSHTAKAQFQGLPGWERVARL